MTKKEVAQYLKSELNLKNFTIKSGDLNLALKGDINTRWITVHMGRLYEYYLDGITYYFYPPELKELEDAIFKVKKVRGFDFLSGPRLKFEPRIVFSKTDDLAPSLQLIEEYISRALEKMEYLCDLRNLYYEMEGLYYEGTLQARGDYGYLMGHGDNFKKLMVLALVGAPYYESFKNELHEYFYDGEEMININEQYVEFQPLAERLDRVHAENDGKFNMEFREYRKWVDIRKY